MFDAHQRFGRIPLRVERPPQRLPRASRRQRLIAQPLHQLDDECGRQSPMAVHFRMQLPIEVLRTARGARRKGGLPLPGLLAAATGSDHVVHEALQFFDKPQTQHDRNRPRLADRERRLTLIGRGEIGQHLQVETSGRVPDQLPRDEVDARVAFIGPSASFGNCR
jgi:hypothetical protein